MTSFQDIPSDVVDLIVRGTDPDSSRNLEQTSRDLRQIVKSEKLFENPFETYYVIHDDHSIYINNKLIETYEQRTKLQYRSGRYKIGKKLDDYTVITTESPIQKDETFNDESNRHKLYQS